ncbi:hypothetical protein DEF28_25320 [Marinitenerispora sediminis]|uniref:Uncharacterized protein n=1 Tax=Marinitenerispora sediminis TaxID=1931232 RepID=A0A368SYC6_9ACTN|nr:hypothetical protein DEF28_25320 [Marinitenerispora sediminis]RCV48912.1 hypothetical protein DEF24_25815 [Marinitenerispora sediminis]
MLMVGAVGSSAGGLLAVVPAPRNGAEPPDAAVVVTEVERLVPPDRESLVAESTATSMTVARSVCRFAPSRHLVGPTSMRPTPLPRLASLR